MTADKENPLDKTVKTNLLEDDGMQLSEDPFVVVKNKETFSSLSYEEEVTILEKKSEKRAESEDVTHVHHATTRIMPTRSEIVRPVHAIEEEITDHGVASSVRVVPNESLKKPKNRKKLFFWIGLFLVLLISSIVAGVLWRKLLAPRVNRSGAGTVSQKSLPVPLKLSPLVFVQNDKIVSARQLKAGQTVTARFFIDSWDRISPKKLQFQVDARIFSSNGKLIYFQPNMVEFSEKPAKETRKIRVDIDLQLSTDVPLGLYRVLFNVVDLSTQRHSTLQTKIVIVKP